MKGYRSFKVCLILALIVTTLLAACSAPAAPSPAPTTTTSTPAPPAATSPSTAKPATEAAGPAQVFELKLAHHVPPPSPPANALEEWAKKIETSTSGRVKFTIYPSESLVKGRDAYPSTASGVCDVAFVNNVYEASRWSLNNIINLAALPIPSGSRGIEIWDKLWEKYPQMLKEFEGVKVLARSVSMTTSLHTKKPVRVPDDIKGMKIAAMGDSVRILEAAGASPVSLSAGEWYMSLEKGVIEGILCPVGVLTDRGIEELVKYHLDLGISQGGNVLIINLARWNSFPPDIKAKFEELTLWANDAILKATQQVETEGWQKCTARGNTINKPTQKEAELWLATTKPMAEAWIKANETKAPAREMFDYAQKLIAETKQ